MSSELIPLFKVLMSPEAPARVAEVLMSGQITQGKLVDQFELEMWKALDLAYGDEVLTVNSGTSALHLAYILAGISRGSEVICTPMTCAATITPLVQLGAKIVWADVNAVTGLIDEQSALARISDKTKAIVAVDWAGTPVQLPQVPHHISVIEDAAHAMFAERDGAQIGHIPMAHWFTCWSMQAIKHLTTVDGGLLLCPTSELTERARKLRWFGLDRRSKVDFRAGQDITESGFKYHMNDVAAAIGLANLPLAKNAVARHRMNAHRYALELAGLGDRVVLPPWDSGSSYWIYTITVDDRKSFQKFMRERNIETSEVHRRNDEHLAFKAVAEDAFLPGLRHFADHQVSIPVGWWLSASDLARVIDAVLAWAKS